MTESLLELLQHYWYAWAVGLLLAGIALGFAFRFVWPALRLGVELGDAVDALKVIKETRADGSAVAIDDIAATAMKTPRLHNLWLEYRQTLHPQAEPGRERRWRATTLAESFFSEEALVDSPLKTEFYKHLPGILTGLGIIGTFTGLIIGLINFDVSLDPAQAQTQLRNLINSVGHAFFVSAVAISLAMLFTWIEKSLLTLRYRQVEQLRELIDGMFDVGADYEYLERLVVAAETSATQAERIKDALADQLREIFTEVSTRQVDASARHGEQLAADIGRIVGERLGQPIENIARAVDTVTARQEQVVGKMIAEVLAGFSAQMQSLFAAQMRDTSDLLQRTNAAVASTGERQADVGRQLGDFVAQLRASMLQAQTQSGEMLESTLARLGDKVSLAVQQLQDQTRATAEVHQEQGERIAQQTGEVVGGMATQVERLVLRSIEASHAVQAAVDRLSQATTDAIAGMNSGADTLATAAKDFATAGQGITETLKAAEGATETINFAANTLSAAAVASQGALAAHGQAQERFVALVADLKATVETAKRDASVSAELVDRLHGAAGQLSAAQRKAEDYLRSVNDVLVQAHQSFADSIERTLRESNRQFQLELSQAVGLLSGAIQDLGDLLDDLPARPKASS
jgi:ABC-type transporter Mla subunit MlaD